MLRWFFRAGCLVAAAVGQVGFRLERWLLPKAFADRRAFLRSEAIRHRDEEAERLDRLRNPGDYAGR
jgi:hypothetical protein